MFEYLVNYFVSFSVKSLTNPPVNSAKKKHKIDTGKLVPDSFRNRINDTSKHLKIE